MLFVCFQMGSTDRARRKLAHLPLLRFTSVFTLLIALDSLICLSLWIAGGDSLYLEDNVKDFSFTQSTFDLACIAAVRGVIIIASMYCLEHFCLKKTSIGRSEKQLNSNRLSIFFQAAILVTAGLSLAYSVVKGSLLIKRICNHEVVKMHITYKILCVLSVAFSIVELLFGIISSWCLQRMIRAKGLRLLVNLDLDDEKPLKKKADLKRIMLLAKPVST